MGDIGASSSGVDKNVQDDDADWEPCVDMVFPSSAEYATKCHKYAERKGFSLHIRSSTVIKEYKDAGVERYGVGEKATKSHMYSRLRLDCTKAKPEYEGQPKDQLCTCRIDARMTNGVMKINVVQLEHNHELYPSCSRMMANYRYITDSEYDTMVKHDEAGISIKKNFNTFVVDNGGYDNMKFNERDTRNAVRLHRLSTRIGGDARALEEYLAEQKKMNDEFFYKVQRNDKEELSNVIWVDARSRAAYKDFGDIITFDTTFLCNRYEMPFAPFIGVNHHGSCIPLGAALIAHEDTETFEWVFRSWLECMGGEPPKGILTDQDKAICKAVKSVFPDVPHRLCVFHILQNASRNLGSHSKWPEIRGYFNYIVRDALSPEEFEQVWKEMKTKCKLENNTWINDTYKLKKDWAPSFWRNTFWAGMSSTQRSETMNNFYKQFVSKNTGLRQFLNQYERALKARVEEELKLNFDSSDKPLPKDKHIIVEEVFQKAYTNEKYKEVRDEIIGLIHTNVTKIDSIGPLNLYDADEKIPTPVWKATRKKYRVKSNKEAGDFSCTCKLFEFRGIICRHIIRVLELEEVADIPEKYILSRWRKDVVRDYEGALVSYCDPILSERVKTKQEIEGRFKYLAKLALHNPETVKMCMEATNNLREELEAFVGIMRVGSEKDWFDPSIGALYGKRRIREQKSNLRHLKRAAGDRPEGCTNDPQDKRGTGRANKNRPPHPSENGARANVSARRKRTALQEQAANEADDQDNELDDGLLNFSLGIEPPQPDVGPSKRTKRKSTKQEQRQKQLDKNEAIIASVIASQDSDVGPTLGLHVLHGNGSSSKGLTRSKRNVGVRIQETPSIIRGAAGPAEFINNRSGSGFPRSGVNGGGAGSLDLGLGLLGVDVGPGGIRSSQYPSQETSEHSAGSNLRFFQSLS